MWPDPADPKFKKQTYVGGTPVNKYSYQFAFVLSAIVLGAIQLSQ